jgi:hypothetical protein
MIRWPTSAKPTRVSQPALAGLWSLLWRVVLADTVCDFFQCYMSHGAAVAFAFADLRDLIFGEHDWLFASIVAWFGFCSFVSHVQLGSRWIAEIFRTSCRSRLELGRNHQPD